MPRSFFTLLLSVATVAFTTARPPNLIVVMTDDQGFRDVGFNGGTDIPTPHLDSIAHRGVRFTNGYVTYAVCSPSRAGFLTGRYPQRFGYERNPQWQPDDIQSGLPLSESTLADTLGQVGYRSGLIGKWHLGAHPALHPLRRGFDEFFGHLGGGHRYLPEELTLTESSEADSESESYHLKILRNHTPVTTTEYLTDEFSHEAVRFVERHRDHPFFLFLAYNAPHSPLQATEKYLSRFAHIEDPRRRTYAAMVSAVDDGVGRVLIRLRELELESETIVVFLSDNGGATDSNTADNTPLRGAKGSAWDGGWRVPFALQWPGHIAPGQVYEHPVISLDIFATIAALAGAPTNAERSLDGVNLIPFLTGEDDGVPHEAIHLRMFDRGAYAVRSGDDKLLITEAGEPARLYDLRLDIGETRDAAAARPGDLQRLDALRLAWNAQLIPPIFPGLNQPRRKTGE